MKRKVTKKVISVLCALAMTVTGIPISVNAATTTPEVINDNTTAMEKAGYSFDHSYVKPGDTLKVLYTEDETTTEVTENVSWTVKKVASGTYENKVAYETVATLQQPTLPIKNEYLETMIYGEINGTKLTIYCSKTPVMYINSETEYYKITEEYTDEDTTTINLVGNDTYKDEKYWYDGTGEVKLRGNSTSKRPKRPFKLKLSDKADLLGLGTQKNEKGEMESYESKHWVLLANDIDHSLIRNKLLYDFSGDIGTEFYFDSTNITLIYNGQYEGVYQLCEHRRVDEGRIDITNWTSIGEDAADTIGSAVAEEKGWDKSTKKDFISELEDKMITDFSWIDSKKVTTSGGLADATYEFSKYGITLPKTNGGFLAEMDFYSIGDNTLASIATNYQQPMYFSAPEPGEDAKTDAEKIAIVNSFKKTSLFDYANRYTQTFEYALHSDDFFFRNSDKKYKTNRTGSMWKNWKDATYSSTTYTDNENNGKHYSQLFDMDSLVNNFIFVEYAMNWDSMKNSFFFYKEVDKLAKFGPQWDFDWCWGNTNMYNLKTNYPTSWQTTVDAFTVEQYYQTVQWNRMLIRDPYFLTLAYEKYHAIRPIIENMIKTGGLIDQYTAYLKEAGAVNDLRWSYTYATEYSGAKADNFTDSIAHIKEFLNKRVAWLDEQFKSVSTLTDSLGYYQKADSIKVVAGTKGTQIELRAETTNTNAKKVTFQINGTTQMTAAVKNGTATVLVDKSKLKATGLNTVVANEVNGSGNYIYNTSASKTGNYNVVSSNYTTFALSSVKSMDEAVKKLAKLKLNVTTLKMKKKTSCSKVKVTKILSDDKVTKWKSSNSKIVSVNKKGKLTAKKVGKATITATTKLGATAKIKVTVIKGNVKTTKITLAKKKISLKKGKKYTITPEVKPISTTDKLKYKSSKKKVATVSKKGVVKAKKKGKTVITVTSGKKKVKLKVTVK